MKRVATLLVSLLLGSMGFVQLHAQCEPDTANCEDTGDPGQICPMVLPRAGLNALYDEVVTIIPPGSFNVWGNELTIYFIEIDSIMNLPPGIDYFPSADILYPDTAYCVQLTGTPTQTGDFELAIYITATVDFLGNETRAQVVDDSSVILTVVEALGTESDPVAQFQVFQNIPNPFSTRTRLAYYSPKQEELTLSVYNILGVLVHQESEVAAPGRHQFRFDGSEIEPGTYLYRVEYGEEHHTGKFMKSR